MTFSAEQITLLNGARLYLENGYDIGLTQEKKLIYLLDDGRIDITASKFLDGDWNGISIIPNEIVCVDFDNPATWFDVGWWFLPPTLKERSPRGYHLFYSLPKGNYISKIGWKNGVDFLTKDNKVRNYKNNKWDSHILCSPTKGYSRVYPEKLISKDELTEAPGWLIEIISN